MEVAQAFGATSDWQWSRVAIGLQARSVSALQWMMVSILNFDCVGHGADQLSGD